jgi:hypothetical protein
MIAGSSGRKPTVSARDHDLRLDAAPWHQDIKAPGPAQKTEGVPDPDPAGHAHPDNAPGVVNWAITAGGAIIMHPRGRGDPEAQPQVTVDTCKSRVILGTGLAPRASDSR